MYLKKIVGQGKLFGALLSLSLLVVACAVFYGGPPWLASASDDVFLRISDWKSGLIYVEAKAQVGSRLFFGWIHSQEKIPWNEYYHIDENRDLVLDAITFPAFGAGIPENKGRVCYVKDGLIHMEEINQTFKELVWLNSHTATQDIRLDGVLVTKGSDLPHHARLRLAVESRNLNNRRERR
jgi:hypothetical protein